MKRNFLSGPVIGLWGAGVLFSVLLILVTGGTVGSILLRLFLNILLATLFVGGGWFLWNRFLSETSKTDPGEPGNDEEDEILLESDPDRLYTETERFGDSGDPVANGTSGDPVANGTSGDPVANGTSGDLFSYYKYKTDSDTGNLRHLDSRNPYEMSDSLLRKFKSEEEDSLAKFKAAFQSPEEIAKAVRTELHKDD